ncbi:hypothetical protein K432DRAFT_337600 [Lepidopterella palustris CBS 459.81]|uniref:Dicer-like protein 2 n=1 Tax=Lepidopterella palustris CBS 459.81 TaxID=1314670 RepID=A0A8E2E0X2_9PEZI|nr:hypothetical protein K432DRAFT_337600 [Lepidopterella palustris CBS 459.81]
MEDLIAESHNGIIHIPIDNDDSTVNNGTFQEPFRLRSYQTEMVEDSLKENIIVAMDTGSGKTHIALERTSAELQTCSPDQLVWFLAPTVTLCHQQYQVFLAHLPAFGVRFLSGEDNLDRWTDQYIWDAILKNIRIVVSTHAVLLDALTHGFVKLAKLALMIFDEAHHCTLKHPANQIMNLFYKPLLLSDNTRPLPAILGLSASPVINAKAKGLQTIEQNLNAIIKTPKIHRSELIRFVHRPQLSKVSFSPSLPSSSRRPAILDSLRALLAGYDIMQDPYVVDLVTETKKDNSYAQNSLNKVLISQDTYCRKQLKTLADRSEVLYNELGDAAACWYLRQCNSKYENMVKISNQQLYQMTEMENKHLLRLLQKLDMGDNPEFFPGPMESVSAKVQSLIDTLVAEAGPEFTGLIFVEQRATVVALAQLLSAHSQTRNLFNIGTFVGTSISLKRKVNIADLAEPRNQKQTLEDFRVGKKNLIIATSVLEEGIDVSSCDIVICFEPPKNLKSFIQRRGRARKEQSKYIILVPDHGSRLASPDSWHDLEEEMKRAYMDDLRKIKAVEEMELAEEDGELNFRIAETGALLTLDNASQHLHHFCALLKAGPYIDTRPQFSFKKENGGTVIAHVTLPISVAPSVRSASSSRSWKTERNAKKDAAFQAYKALHTAGLVNDNLLPLIDAQDETPEFNVSCEESSLVPVAPKMDPWIGLARQQQFCPRVYYKALFNISSVGENPLEMVMLTPCPMPYIPPGVLYWNESKQYIVTGWPLDATTYTDEEITTMRAITRKMLFSVFDTRMHSNKHDFLALFVPGGPREPWSSEALQKWHSSTEGNRPALDLFSRRHTLVPSDVGLIRMHGDVHQFIFKGIRPSGDNEVSEILGLEVIKLPKRRDFLHRIPEASLEKESYTTVQLLDASACYANCLPSSYSTFALFVPSILHRYEVFMMAENLRTTVLAPVSFDSAHLGLLVTAISASSTNEADNYQRLEFLGDCILKFSTSIHLMASHPNWPESYLTVEKGRTNANKFLAKASLAAGLDRFIITEAFTGSKWTPKYASDLLSTESEAKESILRSTKLLADVIESLIGACYVEGGLSNAFTCIQTLLPTEKWIPSSESCTILFNTAPSQPSPTHLSTVETLIDYTFTKKCLLLEALTHASFSGPVELSAASYQRLEFLGDAVLDYIVVLRLFSHKPELPHQTMHTIRTAMVNASFLAFLAFEATVPEDRINVTLAPATHNFVEEPEVVHRALWQFLRYSSPEIFKLQQEAITRHQALRQEILHALQHGRRYPWHLLARTDPQKLFSDIVESVIGAIYIDSCGDLSACERFVKRLGILEYLERVISDGLDCLHPKERLGHLAVSDKVEYVPIGNGEDGGYKCQVKVGGREFGSVVEGLKRVNVETEAAWRAVRILEGLEEGKEEETMEIVEGGDAEGGIKIGKSEGRGLDENKDEDEGDSMKWMENPICESA